MVAEHGARKSCKKRREIEPCQQGKVETLWNVNVNCLTCSGSDGVGQADDKRPSFQQAGEDSGPAASARGANGAGWISADADFGTFAFDR